ncbi:hypothetical protein [Streptomyces rubellomurinus]|uniref:Uncharacterized protein n=2 Tax=Streptomyces TaxID=1883 RepID=A0A0F2TJ72_STRR3|nr:hypothetical protein [Streptomyces rubellomurinus]KJS56446.1 hypothetical protein VM98_07155 [Streptomyces rubellomurinus subsp. indigoferus]KJS61772.1 hypothetical protein VM95_13130 [Streptomyces rubellomurinus]
MPRPSAGQLCLGSFTVVAATVALLAVSGATGVLAVAVLVGFALALGTAVTLLSQPASDRRSAAARRAEHFSPTTGRAHARQP